MEKYEHQQKKTQKIVEEHWTIDEAKWDAECERQRTLATKMTDLIMEFLHPGVPPEEVDFPDAPTTINKEK